MLAALRGRGRSATRGPQELPKSLDLAVLTLWDSLGVKRILAALRGRGRAQRDPKTTGASKELGFSRSTLVTRCAFRFSARPGL